MTSTSEYSLPSNPAVSSTRYTSKPVPWPYSRRHEGRSGLSSSFTATGGTGVRGGGAGRRGATRHRLGHTRLYKLLRKTLNDR
jgi:hypothetical protein